MSSAVDAPPLETSLLAPFSEALGGQQPIFQLHEPQIVQYERRPVSLVLSDQQLLLFRQPRSCFLCCCKRKNLKLKVWERLNHTDLIGFRREETGKKKKETIIRLFYYPRKKESSWCCCSSSSVEHKRVRKELKLTISNESADKIEGLVGHISAILHGDSLNDKVQRDRLFLVFVNPFSGQKKALSRWEKIVQPMFDEANIKYHLVLTQYSNHAKEYLQRFPSNLNSSLFPTISSLTDYSAIVALGGDGTLSEVINGILSRPDGMKLLSEVPVIPLPGGSSNALSKSILFAVHESSKPLNATFNLIRGKRHPLDLSQVVLYPNSEGSRTNSQNPLAIPSTLLLSEPATSIDQTTSEQSQQPQQSQLPDSSQPASSRQAMSTSAFSSRFLSDHRPTLHHNSQVYYSFLLLGYGLIADIDINSEPLRFLGELRFYLYAFAYILQRKQYGARLKMKLISSEALRNLNLPADLFARATETVNSISNTANPPNPPSSVLSSPVGSDGNSALFQFSGESSEANGWKTIESNHFSFITVIQTTHISDTAYFGPGIRLDDGVFTVVVGENLTRWQMLEALLKADSGEHFKMKGLQIFRCTEYELEPFHPEETSSEKKLIYTLDGERLDASLIRGTVLPGAAQVMLLPS